MTRSEIYLDKLGAVLRSMRGGIVKCVHLRNFLKDKRVRQQSSQ